MGLYTTILKTNLFCKDCGRELECQSKTLWLNYKGHEFFVGDTLDVIEIDENFHGNGCCVCNICTTKNRRMDLIEVDIIKGKLIKK